MKSDEKSLKGMTLGMMIWVFALFGMATSVSDVYHKYRQPCRRRPRKRPSLSHNLLILIRQAVTKRFNLSKHLRMGCLFK